MKIYPVCVGIALLLACTVHPSFSQDADKASTLHNAQPHPSVSVLGNEVECIANKARNFPCEQVNLLALLSVADLTIPLNTGSSATNDIWGWTDPETGIEYALLGMNNGTMFISLQDPQAPAVAAFLPSHTGASLWRDVKVYENHAFIVADNAGSHGIQIFDLTTLRGLTQPTTVTATARYSGIASAHNIVINESSGFAYAVGSNSGGNTCGGGLHMINIQDPQQPTFAGCFADPTTGFARTGYTHDAQCVIYAGPDTEHQGEEICIGSNESFISVANVSDKENPVILSKGSYPNSGYIHQGWLTEDHRHFFQNDELDEGGGRETRTLIWDLEDLDDPVLLGDFFSGLPAIDHNLYIRGKYLFQANYTSGLRIWDVTDPSSPQFFGYFDTFPGSDAGNFAGAWSTYPYFESGIVIVSGINEGLFVLNPTLPTNTSEERPEIARSFDVAPPYPNPSRGMATLTITSAEGSDVTAEIINAAGQVVRTFTERSVPQTTTLINLDTRDLPNGSYFIRVINGGHSQVHPLAILD